MLSCNRARNVDVITCGIATSDTEVNYSVQNLQYLAEKGDRAICLSGFRSAVTVVHKSITWKPLNYIFSPS